MSNKQTLDHVLDLLYEEEGISYKKMFGGFGLFKNDIPVALILNSGIYMKVNNSNRDDYVNMGSMPFSYVRNGKEIKLSNWLLPGEIMETEQLFIDWFNKSYQAAIESKKGKKNAF
tara:strand:- start:182 stop:529 length:348 start_codon:yes stop_codon:yes gene_type:complete